MSKFLQALGTIGSGVLGGVPGLIVGAGSSLLSGAIGNIFSSKNQSNAQSWNEEMYNEQKKFWYEQQEYNSPENQVERLREAGINPGLAVGNIESGQMGTLPSAPYQQPQPVASLGNINSAIDTLLRNQIQSDVAEEQIRGQQLDNEGKEIDLMTRLTENLLRLHDMMSGINNKDSSTAKNQMEIRIAQAMAMPQFEKLISEIQHNTSVTAINWLNYARGMKELEFLPQQQRLEYLERMAGIAKMEAETESEIQRKKKLVEETNHEYFKWKGQHFVNTLNQKTEQYLIDKARYEAERMKNPKNIWDAGFEGFEGFNKFVEKEIVKPSKKAWKDTRRSFGF